MKEENKKIGPVGVIAIVVILLIVGTAIYFIYNNENSPTQENKEQTETQETTFTAGSGIVLDKTGTVDKVPFNLMVNDASPGRYSISVITDKPSVYAAFKGKASKGMIANGATPSLKSGEDGMFDVNNGDERNDIEIRIVSVEGGVPTNYHIVLKQDSKF